VFLEFNPGSFHFDIVVGSELLAHLIVGKGAGLDVLSLPRLERSLQIFTKQAMHVALHSVDCSGGAKRWAFLPEGLLARAEASPCLVQGLIYSVWCLRRELHTLGEREMHLNSEEVALPIKKYFCRKGYQVGCVNPHQQISRKPLGRTIQEGYFSDEP
jgi:hypothetical protein